MGTFKVLNVPPPIATTHIWEWRIKPPDVSKSTLYYLKNGCQSASDKPQLFTRDGRGWAIVIWHHYIKILDL